MPGNCPKGGNHDPVNIAETATTVTHECSKCGYTETRPKGNKLVAVLLVLLVTGTLCVIWAGAPA